MRASVLGFLLSFALSVSGCVQHASPHAYPARGQTIEQQAIDHAECEAWAKKESGFDPATAVGLGAVVGALAGGAAGAATGAAVGAAAGSPAKGAAIGAAAGGVGGAAVGGGYKYARSKGGYDKAYGTCMVTRGYTVDVAPVIAAAARDSGERGPGTPVLVQAIGTLKVAVTDVAVSKDGLVEVTLSYSNGGPHPRKIALVDPQNKTRLTDNKGNVYPYKASSGVSIEPKIPGSPDWLNLVAGVKDVTAVLIFTSPQDISPEDLGAALRLTSEQRLFEGSGLSIFNLAFRGLNSRPQ